MKNTLAGLRGRMMSGLLLGSVVLAAAGPTWVRGEFVPREFLARRIESPPTIDGDLTDAVWQQAQVIDQFFAYQSGGAPAAAQTTARILWDHEQLYLGLQMEDASLRPSSTTTGHGGRDANLYEGDVIELFVRPRADSPQYFEFEWSPTGDFFDARFDLRKFGPPGVGWNADVSSAVTRRGTIDVWDDLDEGWTVETAIPLSVFGDVDFDADWYFTIARYDYFNPASSREQLMMLTPGDPQRPNAGLTSGFHTYELYDRLHWVVPEPGQGPWASGLLLLWRRRRCSAAA